VGAIETTTIEEETLEEPARRKGWEVLGVLILAATVYYVVSLFSYPGLSIAGEILGENTMSPVSNALARWSLSAIGLSVYPLCLVFFAVALRLILRRGMRTGAPMLLASISWAVSFAVIFHVALRGTPVHGAHLAGGAVGELLGEVLCSLFSVMGTYLFAGVTVLVTAMLATDLSVAGWVRLFIRIGQWLWRLTLSVLDRLGGAVINVAERWESSDESEEGEVERSESAAADSGGAAVAFFEEATVEGGAPRAKGGKTSKKAGGVEPRVAKKSGQTAADEDALEFRPLPTTEGWRLPPLSLLDEPSNEEAVYDETALKKVAASLEEALTDYGVAGEVTDIHPGPVVTLYEYKPKSGTKLSKISGLRDELAMRLEVERVRIVAPIPGKNAVGFEVPNEVRAMVGLRNVLGHVLGKSGKKLTLPLALGRDIGGAPKGVDLAKMPHLIVAGTTGSGKSVCVNALLLSLLFRFAPRDLRMILIDPKEVELGGYDEIPHLLVPVVTDMTKAASALRWAVDEMERRYDLFAKSGVRNIVSYNKKVPTLIKSFERANEDVDPEEPGARIETPPDEIPYIVIVLDELADLMMVAARDVETAIARLAQKARAAGIHLVVATQRPSTDVMSGTIRNNFPARISFRVATGIDSRTVLDTQGAESLLGAGDMLVRPPGTSDLVRVHGAYVSEEEVERVVAFIREQGRPNYEDKVFAMPTEEEEGGAGRTSEEDEKYSEKYDIAVELVTTKRRASVSFIQRHLRVGYNTAARLMERMEAEGIVGPERGARPREVLADPPPDPS